MSLPHGILGFLTYEKMSGYDLAKAFRASVQFFWNAQNSQIYLTLDKLEKQSYVTHELIVQTDKPNKKLYSITESGKAEFLRWLSDNAADAATDFKSAFLMKIFFSGNRTPDQSITMLKKFVDDCRSYTESMSTIPDSIAQYGREVPAYVSMYWQFAAGFGYRYLHMCMEWAQECIEQLKSLQDMGRSEKL